MLLVYAEHADVIIILERHAAAAMISLPYFSAAIACHCSLERAITLRHAYESAIIGRIRHAMLRYMFSFMLIVVAIRCRHAIRVMMIFDAYALEFRRYRYVVTAMRHASGRHYAYFDTMLFDYALTPDAAAILP